jgi:hypothetical protein
MPIDRIGKGGGALPPQAPGASGPEGAAPTAPTKTFEVGAAKKADATEAVSAAPLDELRAGKIDVHQYVEKKLDEATAHLKGLQASELAHIRDVLRDKMVQDPQLSDLVRQAAGSVPTPHDE